MCDGRTKYAAPEWTSEGPAASEVEVPWGATVTGASVGKRGALPLGAAPTSLHMQTTDEEQGVVRDACTADTDRGGSDIKRLRNLPLCCETATLAATAGRPGAENLNT